LTLTDEMPLALRKLPSTCVRDGSHPPDVVHRMVIAAQFAAAGARRANPL
jgi:hypothetical protein